MEKWLVEKPDNTHRLSRENMLEYIEDARKNEVGIYNPIQEVPLDEVKLEVKDAKEEFGQYVDEERQRIKLLADEENERIMKKLREKEADVACPFCLEDIPAIFPIEETPKHMICCGARLCKKCSENWLSRQDKTKPLICFS